MNNKNHDKTLLQLDSVSFKHARSDAFLVRNISFVLKEQERISIIGRSGSGKTRLLEMISGLIKPYSGKIFFQDSEVDHPIESMAFISKNIKDTILPWFSIIDNIKIAFSLNLDEVKKTKKALEVMEYMGLAGLENEYPNKCSLGLQTRIAVARAIALQPAIIVIDDIFSNLDCLTSEGIRNDLEDIINAQQISLILATNSIEEAVFLTDKVIILGEETDSSSGIKAFFDISHLIEDSNNNMQEAINQIYESFLQYSVYRHSFSPVNETLAMLEEIKYNYKKNKFISMSDLAEYVELTDDSEEFFNMAHTLKRLGLINIVDGAIFLTKQGDDLIQEEDLDKRKNMVRDCILSRISSIKKILKNNKIDINLIKTSKQLKSQKDIDSLISWIAYADLS